MCSLSQASISRTRVSPFCIEAKKHGLHFEGGKADDITVLCVKVLEEEEVEAAIDLGASANTAAAVGAGPSSGASGLLEIESCLLYPSHWHTDSHCLLYPLQRGF